MDGPYTTGLFIGRDDSVSERINMATNKRTYESRYHDKCPGGPFDQIPMFRLLLQHRLKRALVKSTGIMPIDSRDNSFTIVALAWRKAVLEFDSLVRRDSFQAMLNLTGRKLTLCI